MNTEHEDKIFHRMMEKKKLGSGIQKSTKLRLFGDMTGNSVEGTDTNIHTCYW